MCASICGADCGRCGMKESCLGCRETAGCPFGRQCFIAEYIHLGGEEKFREFRQQLLAEFNALKIKGLPPVEELHPLLGSFVNLEYVLPSGESVKFLDDYSIYLGNQLESTFGGERCFGLLAGLDFLLVCEYSKAGGNPELLLYKRR